MPKKSNKTAHVLSLLTNGGGEFLEGDISICRTEPGQRTFSEPAKKEVVVELQGSIQPDFLSDLVKSDLQKELNKQLSKKSNTDSDGEADSPVDERPPYSQTFMSKFGIKPSHEKEVIKEAEKERPLKIEPLPPVSLDQVKSEAYVLEDFNDEEENLPAECNKVMPLSDNTLFAEAAMHSKNLSILHNLAEDIIIARAPEIMQSFNMCTCQECIYNVAALALNNTKPLYTVTDHSRLPQKLSSYEIQYGSGLIAEIKKACIKIKINPEHHPKHPDQNHKKTF